MSLKYQMIPSQYPWWDQNSHQKDHSKWHFSINKIINCLSFKTSQSLFIIIHDNQWFIIKTTQTIHQLHSSLNHCQLRFKIKHIHKILECIRLQSQVFHKTDQSMQRTAFIILLLIKTDLMVLPTDFQII